MSNNISRKGLAFGAIVAIATSLFAGAPAHAAEAVALDSAYGSSLVVPAGEAFTLKATIDSGNYQSLNVRVDNTDGALADVVVGATTTHLDTTDARKETGAGAFLALGNASNFTIKATDATKTSHFTVTVYRDWHNPGVLDADEAFATKTITFLAASALTGTTSFLTNPSYTSDVRTISARFVLTNVNNAQVSHNGTFVSGVSIDIRSSFGAGTYDVRDNSPHASGVDANVTSVATDGTLRFDTAADVPVGVGGVDPTHWFAGAYYTAQAYWKTTPIGAAVSTTGLVNGIRSGLSIATVVNANALDSSIGNGNSRTSVQTAVVRQNSAVKVLVNVSADTKAQAANQAVTFTVDGAWQTGTARVVVNGVSYSTSADLRAAKNFTATTDADGNAWITVEAQGFGTHIADANNDIVISAKSGNTQSPTLTLWQTAAAADVNNATATPANQAVVLGQKASVVVTLNDQFGEPWTASQYTAQAWMYDSSVASGDALTAGNQYAALANGAATLSFGGDANVTGDSRWTIQLRKNDVVNGGYLTTTFVRLVNVAFRTTAQLAAGNILANSADTSNGVVTTGAKDLANQDLTKAGYTAAGLSAKGSVSGYAVVTTGRALPYAAVTIKGAGILFTDGTTYSVGSITVNADANGYFSANYASNTTGDLPITVTAGAVSVSTTVTINAPDAGAGRTIDVTAPTTTLLAGDNAQVTFSVRDVYGNRILTGFNTTNTLEARVSGDVKDYAQVPVSGYLTVSETLTKTGTAYFTATYSSAARLVTQQVRVDWALETLNVDAPEAATAGQNVDVVVTVLNPAGDPIAGKSITATSSGVGNLTVATAKTDANGQAYLKLFAAAGELGWAYVTATDGTVTADVAGIQFQAAPTATDSVATLTLDAPASAQAGTVVDVTATATDADGNAVAGAVVSATSTGVGYLAVASGTTDADGKVTLKLVVTAGENGTASVSATSGDATADAATVTAGATDANITLAKKRVTVDWSFAANKKVVIVRDGAVVKSFTASSNAADSFSFNLKKGTHKVSVKVGGVTLDSQSYKITK